MTYAVAEGSGPADILPHGVKQVVEPVALNDDVLAHGLGRGKIVAGADCRHNRLVFGKGASHTVANLQLHPPVWAVGPSTAGSRV
jgi:hypothetical protein